jgi:hypothetical protein
MFSGPWQWPRDASVKKAVAIKECRTLDLPPDLFNWANYPPSYRYPTTVGGYSAASPYEINNTTFVLIISMN